MRYIGKQGAGNNTVRQPSLFEEDELKKWLDMDGSKHHDKEIEECRLIFLEELRKYGKATTASFGAIFNDVPIFYDKNRKWAPASEFILYADEGTLELIQTGDDSMRAIHSELLENNRDDDAWMCKRQAKDSFRGAKRYLEFPHIFDAIRKLVGESIQSWEKDHSSRAKNLSRLVMYLMKNPEMMPKEGDEQYENFRQLKWVPIGLQDGFSEEQDFHCKWEDFPILGPAFDEVWGEEEYNPHITLDGYEVSPLDSFTEDDRLWMREKMAENPRFYQEIGVSDRPKAERMFLACAPSGTAVNDPLPSGLNAHLSTLSSIPEKYSDQEIRFFHSGEGKWYIFLKSESGENEAITVDDAKFSALIPDAIPVSDLSKEEKTLLKIMGAKKATDEGGVHLALSTLLSNWEAINDNRNAVEALEELWYHYYHGSSDESVQALDSQTVLFPFGDELLDVGDMVIIGNTNSKLGEFSGEASVFRVIDLKEGGSGHFNFRNETSLSKALVENGATSWDELCDYDDHSWYATATGFQEEIVSKISAICSQIFPDESEIDQDKALSWFKSMLELEWAFSSDGTKVPLPHWSDSEMRVTEIDLSDSTYLAPEESEHYNKIQRFRDNGLQVILSDQEIEQGLAQLDHPFLDFDSDIEKRQVSLRTQKRDRFHELEKYLRDIAHALGHRFSLDDERNPLASIKDKTTAYRTSDYLQERWECSGIEVDYGATDWSISMSSDLELEVTFITTLNESKTKQLVQDILRRILNLRLKPDSNEQTVLSERLLLLEAIGSPERTDNISTIFMEFLHPLVEKLNPISWRQISGFEEIWREGRSPELTAELVLNPEHSKAIQTITDWYREEGCQLCGQLTPSRPDGTEFEERRIQIFKKHSTTYRWVTETDMEGQVGNLLYLCPNHGMSHSKKCLQLFLSVSGEIEPVELSRFIEMVEAGDSEISKIKDGLHWRCYERRGRSESPASWGVDEDELEGASWSEIAPIRFRGSGGEHEGKIVDQIIKYIDSRI